MKSTALSLLFAATSVFAAPATSSSSFKRTGQLVITDFYALTNRHIQTSNMHFVLTDANYPDDTPTECYLMWTPTSDPDQNARCNNSEYYIRFPNGVPEDMGTFAMQLERVSGPIAEKGQVVLTTDHSGSTGWVCSTSPDGIATNCNYNGVLNILV